MVRPLPAAIRRCFATLSENVTITSDAFIDMSSSLRESSPIWASEASEARTRERAAKPRGAEERRACNDLSYNFICVLRPDEGKYHWLNNDVPEIKVD